MSFVPIVSRKLNVVTIVNMSVKRGAENARIICIFVAVGYAAKEIVKLFAVVKKLCKMSVSK